MSAPPPFPPLAQKINLYGTVITLAVGVVGHSCSLVTFSQRKLRSTSTIVLLLSITISDLLFLLIILHDFLLLGLNLPQLSPYYIEICRFRTFILNFAQTTSAWLSVCVSIDRVMRARTPHHVRRWCTKKHALITLMIVVACSVGLNSHVLQPLFTTIFPLSRVLCGPSHIGMIDYTVFYRHIWSPLQICVNILWPASMMIVCLIGIYQKVRKQAVVRHNRNPHTQMLALMLCKTILFLTCTLPYEVFHMITIYLSDSMKAAEFTFLLIIAAVLTTLFNFNFSTGFYIHCLTSSLFRQTFIKTVRKCIRWQASVRLV